MPHPRSYAEAAAMLADYEARTHYRVLYFNPPLSLANTHQDDALAVKDGIGREVVRYHTDGTIKINLPYRCTATFMRVNGLIPQGWRVEEHTPCRARLVTPTGAIVPFARVVSFHPDDQHAARVERCAA
jgi:hypothetical protein